MPSNSLQTRMRNLSTAWGVSPTVTAATQRHQGCIIIKLNTLPANWL